MKPEMYDRLERAGAIHEATVTQGREARTAIAAALVASIDQASKELVADFVRDRSYYHRWAMRELVQHQSWFRLVDLDGVDLPQMEGCVADAIQVALQMNGHSLDFSPQLW